ncbi:MAG: lipopolysaccharide heptosyltransferase I [Thermodesulfovibrionales bacterium]
MKYFINADCRFFKGDRPCFYHKEEGIYCHSCKHYAPVRFRILIIKLEAVGDVLRTTHILKPLKKKYSDSQITWITKKDSIPLFINNPIVDSVFDVELANFVLIANKFDLVINLDSSPLSSMLATIARGDVKLGYGYDERGFVYPFNQEASEWFMMGIFDDIKKKNIKTYQHIAMEICKLNPDSDGELILNLTESEKEFVKGFALQHNLVDGGTIIGFNTGAGRRWQHKKWTVEGFIGLAKILKDKIHGCHILLYGGEDEAERNNYLKMNIPDAIDTGSRNSIRDFAALVDLCDLLVTGDTLAMHIAIALKKRVIALFGPTSHAEIELYGRGGEKIVSPLDCICCYRNVCNIRPSCMEAITPEMVSESIMRLLNDRRKG